MSNRYYGSKSDDSNISEGVLALLGVVGIVALFVVLAIYGVWAAAFVGSHLWAWFISPVFGLALLTKAQAWGIALLASYWTYHPVTIPIKDERPWGDKLAQIAGLFLYPWLVFLMGWVCHRFFLS